MKIDIRKQLDLFLLLCTYVPNHSYVYNILLSKNFTINLLKIPFEMLRGKDKGAAENSKNPSKVETKYLPKPEDGMSESSVGVYSSTKH